jgi:glycosyltransferase involved in cell wall biosynthesis
MRLIRIAILRDFAEERWYSMDLVADMLVRHLQHEHRESAQVSELCPRFVRFPSRLPVMGRRRAAFTAERIFNRFVVYPRFLRAYRDRFDVFHIVDHSYANLVTALRPERTIVTCHDLDSFEALTASRFELRNTPRRLLARVTLAGLRRASRVVCVSESTRHRLLSTGWIAPDRTEAVPNGVHPSCSPIAARDADTAATALLGRRDRSQVELLHVGSTSKRKRIDVLLGVFAALRRTNRNLRLIHAGGAFTAEQANEIQNLELGPHIVSVPFVTAEVLAAIYRRAALLLATSDAEGFGLPVAESMACGTPVVATDLPVLREVGGEAAEYCPIGQIDAWAFTAARLLRERQTDLRRWRARRDAGLRQAAKYTWSANAHSMMRLYSELTGTSLSHQPVGDSRFPTSVAL